MAPVPVIFSNQDEGAPGPSLLGTGDYNYDSRSMLMTTAAICATREVSWCPSFYRGEQYDSDLALYYLRARYYNPATGRFMSRDPAEAKLTDPATLHRYLYAGGDPINRVDPMGEEAFLESKLLKKMITVTYYSVVLPAVVICGEVSIINFITQELLKENGFPYSILQPCSGVRNAAMTAGVWLLLFP